VKICIVGAGAVGGLMAAKFALAGEDVTVIDRGAHLTAIKDKGIRLESADGTVQTAILKATDTAAQAGKHDFVVLAVKAHHLDQVAADVDCLLETNTAIITIQNGLPWWYFQKLGGPYEGRMLSTLDPGGILAEKIDVDRVVGCVVYPAAALRAPGVVRHISGDRFNVGELDGTETARVRKLRELFTKVGFKSRILTDIRSEIWFKAWGTLCFNPISALTHATLREICKLPETRQMAATMMKEAQAISDKLGITLQSTMIGKRIEGAETIGHKTSMLQDVEAGRCLEIEAIIGSVLEVAEFTHTTAPTLEAVYALVKLLNNAILAQGALQFCDRPSEPINPSHT